MASCVRNIRTKNYQNLFIGFQVTVKNVGDVFLRHSVEAMQTPDGRGEDSAPSHEKPRTKMKHVRRADGRSRRTLQLFSLQIRRECYCNNAAVSSVIASGVDTSTKCSKNVVTVQQI